MLRRVAAFCRPLWPVLLPVLFLRLRSRVVGALGLCWMWRGVPFVRRCHYPPPPPPLQSPPPERATVSRGGGGERETVTPPPDFQ